MNDMNIELPEVTTVSDFTVLLYHSTINGLSMVMHTWWGPTVTITAVLLLVIAYVQGDGKFWTDYNNPKPFEYDEYIESDEEYGYRIASRKHH